MADLSLDDRNDIDDRSFAITGTRYRLEASYDCGKEDDVEVNDKFWRGIDEG